MGEARRKRQRETPVPFVPPKNENAYRSAMWRSRMRRQPAYREGFVMRLADLPDQSGHFRIDGTRIGSEDRQP